MLDFHHTRSCSLQALGDTTSQYRWFALVYLLGMFLVFPGIVFLLSLAGPIVIYVVLVPLATLFLLVVLVNLLQNKSPKLLPFKLRSWDFLPEPLHSLEPVDRLVVSCLGRWRKRRQGHDLEHLGKSNPAFQTDITTLA